MASRISPYKNLLAAKSEKDVESAYRIAFNYCFGEGCINTEFQTDGLLTHFEAHALMEFKLDLDFKKASDVARALIQAIYYLHILETKGKPIPKVIFVGDIDECFCLPINTVTKYLAQKDVDWNIAPSQAYTKNLEMYEAIKNDKNICPFIYDVNENFGLRVVEEKIKAISNDKPYAIAITSENITEIFNQFQKNVVKNTEKIKELDLGDVDFVDIFFTCLINPIEAYLHPNKKGVLRVGNREIKVDEKAYLAFFSQFRQLYTTEEKKNLTANKDQILEDIHRRRTGAFFTPPLFVAKAHEMISEVFGANWKDEYVVWDCAAGTANLTRDYNFKNLYISTIEEHDLKIIREMGYNKGAGVFHYDFLNDDEPDVLGDKVPEGLRKAFEEGKKVLFFINPPYGAASNLKKRRSNDNDKSKFSIASIKIYTHMKKEKIGACTQQVYAQFMYKVLKLKQKYSQVQLCLFAPPGYISSINYKFFRKVFYKKFEFKKGILFQASYFSNVTSRWGISFIIWKNGENNCTDIMLDLVDEINFKLEKIGTKLAYLADEKGASKWAREEIKNIKTKDAPQLSSAIRIKEKEKGGKISCGALGYMVNSANNVNQNSLYVILFSSASTAHNSFSIVLINFLKVIALFCARRTVIGDWINDKDEYLIPNTFHLDYEKWNNDAIVYGLFNSASQQSSLRNITYKGKKWDIHNQFFFMANKEMKELANEIAFDEMYQDATAFPDDAYVYKLLQETKLSDDAKTILETARELIKKTMKTRKLYHEEHSEYHLNAWDAGWAQLKPYLKEYHKEEYNAFRKLYLKFNERMREGVYKFGFLR